MILTGPEIQRIIEQTQSLGDNAPLPRIKISHFNPERVGPNSYDLMLAPNLKRVQYNVFALEYPSIYNLLLEYKSTLGKYVGWLDPSKEQILVNEQRDDLGRYFILPGNLYLGSTLEYISTEGLVPVVDGRSSIGRLGISVHQTAGYCDDSFEGNITLEISSILPVLISTDKPICQIRFEQLKGERLPYSKRKNSRYQGQVGPTPSRLYLDTNSKENSKNDS